MLVALYTSAWIEMIAKLSALAVWYVALYTSAWIEILSSGLRTHGKSPSHSTRVRGLKFGKDKYADASACRTLHECVD